MTTLSPESSVHRERFVLLDLLRGIAAIAVLIYHTANFLGRELLPDAYLAVDLFFLLSGFVIAHNYDRKIVTGMSFVEFMTQRLIRLYPCFILALAIGFILAAGRLTRDTGYFDGWRLAAALLLNAVFLPSYLMPNHFDNIFPFNGAAWSLTFELIANIVYWRLFSKLTGGTLMLLIAASGIALAIIAMLKGTIDLGMGSENFLFGVPRVILTFFLGVALRRYAWDRFDVRVSGGGIVGVVVLLCVTFSISRFLNPSTLPIAQILTIVIIFPALVLLVSKTAPTPRVAMISKLAGDASYPVYLLQVPFMGIFAAVPELMLHMKARELTPGIGIALLVCTVTCSVWVDRYYELPLRRWLKERQRGPRRIRQLWESR